MLGSSFLSLLFCLLLVFPSPPFPLQSSLCWSASLGMASWEIWGWLPGKSGGGFLGNLGMASWEIWGWLPGKSGGGFLGNLGITACVVQWNRTSDLKVGALVAALPSAWRYRISAKTAWPVVRILWVRWKFGLHLQSQCGSTLQLSEQMGLLAMLCTWLGVEASKKQHHLHLWRMPACL